MRSRFSAKLTAATVAGYACAKKLRVIDPHDGCPVPNGRWCGVTSVAGIGRLRVSRRFAFGDNAVVAITAVAVHLIVIHADHRREGSDEVTLVAKVRCGDVGWTFALDQLRYAVVAIETATDDFAVRNGVFERQPGRCRVAGYAYVGRLDVVRGFSLGTVAINGVAINANTFDLRVVHFDAGGPRGRSHRMAFLA